ncbi:nickase [Weissella confusa]|uniref:MobQ family relaxase n=1 Tax=Weissella confusa TaxID=1583 RepID=UPI00223A99E4|nr:MobQ family relaxase [Weissella confusa]MCT0949464.1 nickase [Weissella confusa]
MAIMHLSFQNISSGSGRSAIASASYRSGEKLFSEKEDRNYFYSRDIKPETFILVPNNAPEWARDRERLWNEVEAAENKANSRYAKEFNVALPIELSDDEQRELLTKYVQQNFVESGMVADVAIHRDHKGNPHAHVMLTNRPFNPDGTWGVKSKKEYILDENGNKMYTGTSRYPKSRKILTTDWDKKEKINEWRANWAKSVNRVLEEKNLPDRISEKTLEEQGIKEEPTKHEGRSRYADERRQHNEQIRRRREARKNGQLLDDKIKNQRHLSILQNRLSFDEKHLVANLSKELQTFVSLESLDDKQRMLFNWKNSVLIKNVMGDDVGKQLAIIESQEQSMEKANEILNKAVERAIEKYYPELDISATTFEERRELIKETDASGEVFKGVALIDRLNDIRSDLIANKILAFTKRPFNSWLMLDKQEELANNKLEKIASKYGQTLSELRAGNRGAFERYSDEDLKLAVESIKDLRTVKEIRGIVQQQYNEVLGKVFPAADLDSMPVVKKEQVYTAVIYYNVNLTSWTAKDIEQLRTDPQQQFNTVEHRKGMAYLLGNMSLDDIDNKQLKRVLTNNGTTNLFIAELKNNPEIDQKEIIGIQKKLQNDQNKFDRFRSGEMPTYTARNYKEFTTTQYVQNVFSDAVMAMLYNSDLKQEIERRQQAKGLRDTESEMEKKKRQHQTSNRKANAPRI